MNLWDVVKDGLLIGVWAVGIIAVIACLFRLLGKWAEKSEFLANLLDSLKSIVKKIFKRKK